VVRILAMLVWAAMTAQGLHRWYRSQMKGREEKSDSLRLPLLEPAAPEASARVAAAASAPSQEPALPSKQSLFPKGLGSGLKLPSFRSRADSDQGPRKQAAPPPPTQRKGRDPYDIY